MSSEEVAPAVEKPEEAVTQVEAQTEQVEEEATDEPKAVPSMSLKCNRADSSPPFDDSSTSTGSWPNVTETNPRGGLLQLPNLCSEP